MGFNMQKLMKQAQKMQQDMARAQEELRESEVEGVAGGGMVRVTANGASEILAIHIAPEIVDPEDGWPFICWQKGVKMRAGWQMRC